ncbi:TPA: type II toxin-antitoxin system RelE/ParE family toxin [Candidatus Galligastranaerophilus intestinavium]|uniref:Type II toxin-antitoxin system RelE/ParE family toxin n=1 Tax=Candidatus Galligastranaerophilus intestinavium TaxID=2840836 RepID=A0A9D1FI70_9BACT|nr:type II toxin-antitoxin system RelE/ParE family toxin [Candidatus Galligastranaerophilus intestinavium]
MIKSFKCKETEKIWNEEFSKKLPHDIQKRALRKLMMLNVATVLEDLRIPPNNRLEALTGDRQGQYSIRINDQYRICFRWLDNHSFDVEIVDYH